MNDVVRELGSTLGVAVLDSILTSGYGDKMDAASDSVGAAHEIGGARLVDAANDPRRGSPGLRA